jgi:hypothetical protein
VNMPEQFDSGLANPRSPTKAPRAVEVHIEELVLHGFAPGDRHVIADAVQRELAQLISESQIPVSHGDPVALKQIDAGTFHVKPGSKPQATGTQIAKAVYRSLQRGTRASASAPVTRPGIGSRHP